jgi:hypothetical protein
MENNEHKLQPVKEPSKEMLEYYRSLYERNQVKFIRRSLLEIEHLGSEFEFDGKKLTLMGSIDALLMLVRDENGKYYRLDSSPITKQIMGKAK